VDGGKARIILTTLVTPAEVQDNQPALDLLWRTRFRWKLHPRQVIGDTKYGTIENVAAIEREGNRTYVPLSEVGQRAGVFGEQDFRYDLAADLYTCPGEQKLRFRSQSDATIGGSTRRRRSTARRVRSATGAPLRPAAGACVAASTRTRTIGCEATMPWRTTPR
jgi:hypothetical protein